MATRYFCYDQEGNYADCESHPYGPYVLYEDYLKLEKQIAKLEAENAFMKGVLDSVERKLIALKGIKL